MIPNSLSVGYFWNFDMLLEIQLHKPSPLGFAKKISLEREKRIARRQHKNRGFNPFFFSLTFGNPNRATGWGTLESTRNATIDNGEHLSDYIEVNDELFTIGN